MILTLDLLNIIATLPLLSFPSTSSKKSLLEALDLKGSELAE